MQRRTRSLIVIFALSLGFIFMNCVGEELPEEDQSETSSGVLNSPEIDIEEIYRIIDELLLHDDTTFNTLSAEQKKIVVREIIKNKIYPNDDLRHFKSSLPYCNGGYWGANWQYESIEPRYSTSGLLYEVGPNCYMWAPGDDCGADHDDYMLSFYFGNHAESLSQLRPMLKYTSTSWWVRAVLFDLSSRVYEQTPGGERDNYNIYSCIDDYYYPYLSTFIMRKY